MRTDNRLYWSLNAGGEMIYSRKKLAEIEDYDRRDCTTTGYRWTLWADGHLSAEWWSCWQGTRSGQTYITDPGHVDLRWSRSGSAGSARYHEALLTMAVEGTPKTIPLGVRRGAGG